jgi:nitroimidazol reductase NimA-like FMN-containing flavoprotein (pyridoxamine 5'-phosphate oxidase superfamily)
MEIDSTGLEVLGAAECVRLLQTQNFGRIAVSAGALPVVLPVNFVVLNDQIVIRTRRGTTLAAATRNSVVAFEVDEFDPETGAGWSVMVQGIAREVLDAPELAAAVAAPLARWLDPLDSRHVSISIDVVSGRRVSPAAAASRSTAECGDHDRLDGVESVLGLIEDDRPG